MSVQNLLREKASDVFKDSLSISPDIVDKKLNNAVKKFGYDLDPDSVVLLYDTTVFKSGKEGLLFSGTMMIYKPMFENPISIAYDNISSAKYIEEKKEKDNGQVEITKTVVITLNDGSDNIVLKTLGNCDYNSLASLISEINKKDSGESFTEASQVLTINEMDATVKMAYIKIIINMTYSDDGIVDAEEYSEILSLITRLDYTPEQRVELRAYMTIDKMDLDTSLEETEKLVSALNTNCPIGNEKSIHISLVKDLINVYRSASNESTSEFDFLNNNRELFAVTDAEIELAEMAIDNDKKMFNEDVNDDVIKESMKELVAKASAVGVPMAAVYMSGSVIGVGAAGITSGLATLGFGGVLGFSSMATGLGVFILVGLGAYKGVKHLTGSSEIEKKKKREFMLQEVVKHTHKTINMLIEDMNFISVKLIELTKSVEIDKIKIIKLTKAFALLSKAGKNLSNKATDFEGKALRTKCPTILDINKLKTLTEEPTKKKYYDLVIKCYEEQEVEDEEGNMQTIMHIKANLSIKLTETLIKIFEAVGYFNASSIAKGVAKNFAKKLGGLFE